MLSAGSGLPNATGLRARMMQAAAGLHLHYRPEPGARARIGAAVHGFLQGHGLGERSAYAVDVVLEEWLSNVTRHGFERPEQAGIDIEIEVGGDQFVLRFRDRGRPFDPGKLQRAPAPTSLDAAQPGGLGLAMIRHFVAGLLYERSDGENLFEVHIARRP